MKANSSANPFNGKIIAITLTITILIIGTFFYFSASSSYNGAAVSNSKDMRTAAPQEQMKTNDNSNNINNNLQMPKNTAKEKTQDSDSLFNHILQENRIFTKKDENGKIKLFYYYKSEEPIDIKLKEGNIKDYQIHSIGGQYYYPIILGSEEADAMREEGFFNNVGDPIKNFYGKNVVVVGVMKKLDNAFDMIHIMPLNSGELS